MLDVLNFSIPGKPEYIQMLRLAIGSIAGKSGFDVEKIEDIKVAVAEACKLVTCHGRDGLSAKYELTVEIEDGRMQITVSDLGSGHTIEKYCQQCTHCPEDGDLAIFVMDSLMDETELFSNENVSRRIKMVKIR